MSPVELHEYLQTLKHKNSQDPNIVQYKKEIREALVEYRTTIPRTNLMLKEQGGVAKDVVFYSFMGAPGKPKIEEHDYKRLKISWSSLRKYRQLHKKNLIEGWYEFDNRQCERKWVKQ